MIKRGGSLKSVDPFNLSAVSMDGPFHDNVISPRVDIIACTKIFRCARTSIPNIEIINKKYLIKTKNSKIIIFMRGGILSFSTNKG